MNNKKLGKHQHCTASFSAPATGLELESCSDTLEIIYKDSMATLEFAQRQYDECVGEQNFLTGDVPLLCDSARVFLASHRCALFRCLGISLVVCSRTPGAVKGHGACCRCV